MFKILLFRVLFIRFALIIPCIEQHLLLFAIPLIVGMIAKPGLGLIALVKADPADIPCVVLALANWWRRQPPGSREPTGPACHGT